MMYVPVVTNKHLKGGGMPKTMSLAVKPEVLRYMDYRRKKYGESASSAVSRFYVNLMEQDQGYKAWLADGGTMDPLEFELTGGKGKKKK
jgi:hypothetical protein